MLDVSQGGLSLLPRQQVHTIKNFGADSGRLLTVIVPAGFERFFSAFAECHLRDGDIDQIVAVTREFGLEILGTLPD